MEMDQLIRKLEDECISMKVHADRGGETMIEFSRIYGDNDQYIYTKMYSWELIFYSGVELVIDDFNTSYEKATNPKKDRPFDVIDGGKGDEKKDI